MPYTLFVCNYLSHFSLLPLPLRLLMTGYYVATLQAAVQLILTQEPPPEEK